MTVEWMRSPGVVVVSGSFAFDRDAELARAERLLPDHVRRDLRLPDDFAVLQELMFAAPLFAPPTLLVVHAANKCPKEGLVHLRQCCEQGGIPDGVLVLVSEGRTAKWFRALKRNEELRFDPPKPWELASWVVGWSRDQGFTVPKYLAEALVQNVGDDAWALTGELTKIFLLMGEKRLVEGSDMTRVLVQHEALKPWLIIDAWAGRKFDLAARLFTLFMHQNQDDKAMLGLVVLFYRRIQALLTYITARKSGMAEPHIAEFVNLKGKAFDALTEQSVFWKPADLRKAHHLMCDIEEACKSSGDAVSRMHLFLYEFDENSR